MSPGPAGLALGLRPELCTGGATSCQPLLSASSRLLDSGPEVLTRPARSGTTRLYLDCDSQQPAKMLLVSEVAAVWITMLHNQREEPAM